MRQRAAPGHSLLVLAFCALTLGAGRAHAADTPDAEAERAKQLYALGAEAFAAQHNADAIHYFRRAAEIVPSSKLTYNIALAYEEMGDSARALSEYRDYLRHGPDAERREQVLGRIVELEQKLAETGVQQLSILSRPSGATVRIGERALGVTPWSGELPPGLHHVSVDLPGHAPRRADVTLEAGRAAELQLELTREPPPLTQEPLPSAWSRIEPLTWSFLGVGVGGVAAGLAFELSRADSSARAARATSVVSAAEARGAADAKQMASLLLLGFGGGFLIGGGVLLVLDLSHSHGDVAQPKRESVSPLALTISSPCAPGFCGVNARGSF